MKVRCQTANPPEALRAFWASKGGRARGYERTKVDAASGATLSIRRGSPTAVWIEGPAEALRRGKRVDTLASGPFLELDSTLLALGARNDVELVPHTATLARGDYAADVHFDRVRVAARFLSAAATHVIPGCKRVICCARGSDRIESVYWSKPGDGIVLRIYDWDVCHRTKWVLPKGRTVRVECQVRARRPHQRPLGPGVRAELCVSLATRIEPWCQAGIVTVTDTEAVYRAIQSRIGQRFLDGTGKETTPLLARTMAGTALQYMFDGPEAWPDVRQRRDNLKPLLKHGIEIASPARLNFDTGAVFRAIVASLKTPA